MTDRYILDAPATWTHSLKDDEILHKIHDSEFSRRQLDEEGKDFCYYINHTYYTDDREFGDYVLMIYSLNQPATLESASMLEFIVEKEEYYKIHRVAVIRNGELIDKIPSINIKLLDVDTQNGNRILNNTKKLSINIRDLHLGDILVIENTRCRQIQESDFLKKEFDRYIWVGPDNYWAYGEYELHVINQRTRPLAYKKAFFRDESGTILPKEQGVLNQGEEFHVKWTDHISHTDQNRELYPYIDFATDCSWEELANYIAPIYEDILSRNQVEDFAPDLIDKIAAYEHLEDKIQFVIEYVQNNIYYIFNSDEMDGHQPQDAAVTYLNKQGDCKAKTVLLKKLLDHIGVESSIILVNFNNDFFIPHYLPSLFAFNHVITQIKHNDTLYHVDPTQRDQYGLLGNRGNLYFKNYLEIRKGAALAVNAPFEYPKFSVEEKISMQIEKSKGTFKITSLTRYNRANHIRQYLKRTNKQEIIDNWNQFLFTALSYNTDRSNTDPRHIFKDVTVGIAHDDKKLNEVTVIYEAHIDNAYFREKNKNFMIYYDGSIYKNAVKDYNHKDVPLWHTYDSEKYEISLVTDKKINTDDYYTKKECKLDNKYFKHSNTKSIVKNGVTAYIEYCPKGNIEVEFEDLEQLKNEYQIIADSNFGVGAEVVELNVFDHLLRALRK